MGETLQMLPHIPEEHPLSVAHCSFESLEAFGWKSGVPGAGLHSAPSNPDAVNGIHRLVLQEHALGHAARFNGSRTKDSVCEQIQVLTSRLEDKLRILVGPEKPQAEREAVRQEVRKLREEVRQLRLQRREHKLQKHLQHRQTLRAVRQEAQRLCQQISICVHERQKSEQDVERMNTKVGVLARLFLAVPLLAMMISLVKVRER